VNIVIRGNTITGSREDGIQLIDYDGNATRKFVIERLQKGSIWRWSEAVELGNSRIQRIGRRDRVDVLTAIIEPWDLNAAAVFGGRQRVRDETRNARLEKFRNRGMLVAVPGPPPVQKPLKGFLRQCLGIELDGGTAAEAKPVQAAAGVVGYFEDHAFDICALKRPDPACRIHYQLISVPPTLFTGPMPRLFGCSKKK